MSNSPPTFGTDPGLHSAVEWTDFSTLHRKDDGAGVLYALKAVRQGTLADLVRHVMMMPATERSGYVIEKSGDHRLDHVEIEKLAALPDFPRAL